MSSVLEQLTAVSPLDGRYWRAAGPLSEYSSEFGLIRYRVKVEIEYFLALAAVPEVVRFPEGFSLASTEQPLRDIYRGFTLEDAGKVKEIERTTNHDVKAVEYFIKNKFDDLGLSELKEWIHFGLTSQDINNTATPLMLYDMVSNVYLPKLEEGILKKLETMGQEWIDVPMLARTHGQPASPTRVGKEILVFVERLRNQLVAIKNHTYLAKFGGATGGFNAHAVSFPDVCWTKFSDSFITGLGLTRSQYTTQIAHYDDVAALFHAMMRINNILLDFSRDMWTYISLNYFTQKIAEGEVGSSTMPHKVNPIDFENCEGNLGIANSLFGHLSSKLPVSRLQRDLTDSTVLRNFGVPVGHSVLAFTSLARGLGKIGLNKQRLHDDLEANWAVVAEAIQTILRRERIPNAYEMLKELTRTNEAITEKTIAQFVKGLPGDKVPQRVKDEMLQITPHNYIGVLP